MKKTVLAILTAGLLFSCAPAAKKMETAFFPPLPQQPRLQFLYSITGEEDIGKKPSALKEWLIGKRPDMKQIGRPYDMGSAKGKIYISDSTYNKVLIIDLVKKEFDYIKDEKGEGALMQPLGIWVTEDDIKYVADAGRKQIVVFDRDNRFLRAYGEGDQFGKPIDAAVYGNRIYVVDFKKYAVVVIDKDTGKTVQTIGGQGEFYKPTHVIVDHKGNIYVNDSFDFRIMKFDPNGNHLKNFGQGGDGLGSFARPKGIDIDREGHIYVVDATFENAQIFDDETTDLLLFFGGFGPHQGSMYLPAGLYIDYDNVEYFNQYADKDFRLKYLVYVGNLLGDKKLNVYGFGEWIGPPLPVVERKPIPMEPDSKKKGDEGKQ
ncbi:MAG: hypothetical protein CVV37_02485 [Nitrospira bacterium HGW-Nitrospira-1]|nr:MAG: hypothetical protein CVV37_02485 [Nitrospira bacterium HGW-Nitrospira-1]